MWNDPNTPVVLQTFLSYKAGVGWGIGWDNGGQSLLPTCYQSIDMLKGTHWIWNGFQLSWPSQRNLENCCFMRRLNFFFCQRPWFRGDAMTVLSVYISKYSQALDRGKASKKATLQFSLLCLNLLKCSHLHVLQFPHFFPFYLVFPLPCLANLFITGE